MSIAATTINSVVEHRRGHHSVLANLILPVARVHDGREAVEIAHGLHGLQVLVGHAVADAVCLAREHRQAFGQEHAALYRGVAPADVVLVEDEVGACGEVGVEEVGEAGVEELGEDVGEGGGVDEVGGFV